MKKLMRRADVYHLTVVVADGKVIVTKRNDPRKKYGAYLNNPNNFNWMDTIRKER